MMRLVFQSIFGIFVIAVACLWIYISVTDTFDSIRSKLLSLAFGMLVFGIGIWCAWPLGLLVVDWLTGSEHLARYIDKRHAQDIKHIVTETRGFALATVAIAIVNVPGAVVLAYLVRKDRPASMEPWFMLAIVLPISAIVLAAKAQAWTGSALPLSGFLVTVNDSISAAGIAAFLVLWASIWLGTIGTRLIAALPMGPVAAFMTPVATMPYYYGYYQNFGWGWMALLFLGSVLLGFVVNGARDLENKWIEEKRNKSAEGLVSRVLAQVESGSAPDYVLFLRPFKGTGTLDTQSQGEALDLETILARALRPRWLVGLGSHKEESLVGAGRVYFRDNEWWDRLRMLARHANAIIIVPSAHEGTLREIRWLHQERLLLKCVFVMPPTPSKGGWNVYVQSSSTVSFETYSAVDQATLWSEASAALRDSPGFELPPYDERGALLDVDADGRVIRVAPLGLGSALFKVRRLRRALLSLLTDAPTRLA